MRRSGARSWLLGARRKVALNAYMVERTPGTRGVRCLTHLSTKGICADEVEQNEPAIGIDGDGAHTGHMLLVRRAADLLVGKGNGRMYVDGGWDGWWVHG